jgi:putative tricarboxylic transport membrane protein
VTRGRIVGGFVLLGLAGGVAAEATTFTVGFPTDPLGPAAFPFLSVALLVVGGLAFLRETGSVMEALDPDALARLSAATASFVAYALVLDPIGFVPATTLEFGVLAWLFGGSLLKGLTAGVGFAVVLFAIFVYGLRLPLPLGMLFG